MAVKDNLLRAGWAFCEVDKTAVAEDLKKAFADALGNSSFKKSLEGILMSFREPDRPDKPRQMIFPLNSKSYIYGNGYRDTVQLCMFHDRPINASFFEILNENNVFKEYWLRINGIPIVMIREFKNEADMEYGLKDLSTYISNGLLGNYNGLQMIVFTCGHETLFFCNPKIERLGLAVTWADQENNPIRRFDDFSNSLLKPDLLLDYVTNYIRPVYKDKEHYCLVPLKAHQYWASKIIGEKITNYLPNESSYSDPQGHIAHSTGSGKTYTMLTTAINAIRNHGYKKVLCVVDRKELFYQFKRIRYELTGVRYDEINQRQDKTKIRQSLTSPDKKEIGDNIEIAIMGTAANLVAEMKLKSDVLILIDEGHRSQGGDNHRKMRKACKSPIFGFTGTPVYKEDTASGRKSTHEIFGECLHKYLISKAVEDETVLPIRGYYNVLNNSFYPKDQVSDSHEQTILLMAKWVTENHDRYTMDKRFSAILTGSGVPNMLKVYREIKRLNETQNLGLKIAASVSVSYSAKEDQDENADDLEHEVTEEEENEEDILEGPARAVHNINNANAADLMQESVIDFCQNFPEFDPDQMRCENFGVYRREVARKMDEEGGIDILVVVGQFITGFDAKRINTIYVAKKSMEPHNIIQTISRTNRIGVANKTEGRAVFFHDMKRSVDDAIKKYSDTNISKLEDLFKNGSYSELLGNYLRRSEVFMTAYGEYFKDYDESDEIDDEEKEELLSDLHQKGLETQNILNKVTGHLEHVDEKLIYTVEDIEMARDHVRKTLLRLKDNVHDMGDDFGANQIIISGEEILSAPETIVYSIDDFRNSLMLMRGEDEESTGNISKALKAITRYKRDRPDYDRNLSFEAILEIMMDEQEAKICRKALHYLPQDMINREIAALMVLKIIVEGVRLEIESLRKEGFSGSDEELLTLRIDIEEVVYLLDSEFVTL